MDRIGLAAKDKNMLTAERFTKLTEIVIDNFEGGYYHPRMKLQMSASNAAKMGDSGETMFGLDRKHGSQLKVFPEWNEFWAIVDNAGAATNWKHYYLGGEHRAKLKQLTGRIMFGWFNKLAEKYLSQDSLEAIANDDRLIIHFSYASWNGEGWFKRFAAALKEAVRLYPNDKDKIFQTAIAARTLSSNRVIRQQGANMMRVINAL